METIEQRQPLPEMHPDVRSVLEDYSPGDITLLGELAAPAMARFIRLQMHPYLPYAETDARWIIQAFRNYKRTVEEGRGRRRYAWI